MINRTVELEATLPEGVDMKEYYRAVGYLSDWAIERYPFVKIYTYNKSDILAVYKKERSTDRSWYTIAAVWNGNQYTFHS